jgi:hypothetical protein
VGVLDVDAFPSQEGLRPFREVERLRVGNKAMLAICASHGALQRATSEPLTRMYLRDPRTAALELETIAPFISVHKLFGRGTPSTCIFWESTNMLIDGESGSSRSLCMHYKSTEAPKFGTCVERQLGD